MLVLLFLLSIASARRGSTGEPGIVEGRLRVPERPKQPIRVLIDGGLLETYTTEDMSFIFQGVAQGTHLLQVCIPVFSLHARQVVSREFAFPSVRLDITVAQKGRHITMAKCADHDRMNEELAYPLILEAKRERLVYVEQRKGYDWASLLKSPMIWIMGVTLLLVGLLPRMMPAADSEEMKEIQRRQAQMGSATSVLSGLMQKRDS